MEAESLMLLFPDCQLPTLGSSGGGPAAWGLITVLGSLAGRFVKRRRGNLARPFLALDTGCDTCN